jgi:hypothetical protein
MGMATRDVATSGTKTIVNRDQTDRELLLLPEIAGFPGDRGYVDGITVVEESRWRIDQGKPTVGIHILYDESSSIMRVTCRSLSSFIDEREALRCREEETAQAASSRLT